MKFANDARDAESVNVMPDTSDAEATNLACGCMGYGKAAIDLLEQIVNMIDNPTDLINYASQYGRAGAGIAASAYKESVYLEDARSLLRHYKPDSNAQHN